MSGFKDMVARDNFGVFLNCDEFAEKRTVKYDGATYEDIPIVLSGLKEKDRRQLMSDHAQGLYIVSSVLHCALSDLGGVQPERGQRIRINDQEGGGGFFREFYVASSVCEMGIFARGIGGGGRMSFIRVNEVGGDSLERVNKLLHNIPGGVYKAAFSALRRAGDTAKTRAGQFVAAEYTINKGEFMRRVHSKTHITGGAGGVMGMSISFSGTVLPLLTFNTTYSRDGTVQTQVMRNGGLRRFNTHSWPAFSARLPFSSASALRAFLWSRSLVRLPDT